MHEYRFINLFRALAAFWVLAAHAQIWGGYPWLSIPSAKLAVDLFMIVSGFLMVATTRGRLPDTRERVRFWTRRFFRIAPAFYCALALIVMGAGIFLPGLAQLQAMNPGQWRAGGQYDATLIHYSASNIAQHASFLSGLSPTPPESGLPDWSLSLEMQFYALFPLLCLMRLRMVVVATVALHMAAALYGWDDLYAEPSLFALKLQFFTAGMLLFHALRADHLPRRVGLMAAALSLAWLGNDGMVAPVLLLAMFALGLLEVHGQTPARIAAIIRSRVVTFASDVSYGVYLYQGFFIAAFGMLCTQSPWLRSLSLAERTLVLFAFMGVGSYALGWVVYRYVEQPGIALGRRVLAFSLSGRAQPVA